MARSAGGRRVAKVYRWCRSVGVVGLFCSGLVSGWIRTVRARGSERKGSVAVASVSVSLVAPSQALSCYFATHL